MDTELEKEDTRVLDYSSAKEPKGLWVDGWIFAIGAVAWYLMGASGVASDLVEFPLSKKFAFTVGEILVVAILLARGKRLYPRVAAFLAFMICFMLATMWFWN